jgi:hypothetical protein
MPYTSQQLSDLEDIREAARRCSRGIDRLDEELFKSAYWPEATEDHGRLAGTVHEFAASYVRSHAKYTWTMHSISNHTVQLDAGTTTARGEIYLVSHAALNDGAEIHAWYGRYLDRYEKRGVEWRIIERVCVHAGDQMFAAQPMPMDLSAFRQGSFDRPSSGRAVGP